ncbi:MAG: transporter substrate-binding domain-containing protein [Azospirillaceae bacterium]|nr:transporter substrate-binding domain-containing protein [Azospirillaceae bacterium]
MPNRNAVRAILVILAFLIVAPARAQAGEAAVSLTLLTEENPPLNFTDPATGRVTGIMGDLIPPLMAAAGIAYQIQVMPWRRAYHTAQEVPGTCLFAMNQTAERQAQFQWVTPVVQGGAAFFARRDWLHYDHAHPDGVHAVAGLDEVKTLAAQPGAAPILVPAGTVLASTLRAQGLEVTEVELGRMMPMLAAGRADLVAAGAISGKWMVRQAGVAADPVFSFAVDPVGIGCNLGTDPALVERLRRALDTLKRDGTLARIVRNYQ